MDQPLTPPSPEMIRKAFKIHLEENQVVFAAATRNVMDPDAAEQLGEELIRAAKVAQAERTPRP